MFIIDDFLLETDEAILLYEEYAKKMPIIDYHNHLDVKKIAENYRFKTITELWLSGDHYKWRALRANGIDEKFITGNADDFAKFEKWAETVPYTMRNPLYHWTHLELKRYFDIDSLLNKKTAKQIYKQCNAFLEEEEYSVRELLKRMNVEVLCSTDDPIDTLEYHKALQDENIGIKILPTWRPDKLLAVENINDFLNYIKKLERVADCNISCFNDLLEAIEIRQKYFSSLGCRLSDHGLYKIPEAEFTDNDLNVLFEKLLNGTSLCPNETEVFKTGMLHHLAIMNHKMGWVQQFHIGAIRNNSSKLYSKLGADIGCDSIADEPIIKGLSSFLDRLDKENQLTKTILYNLNPKDSDALVTMAYNFNDGSIKGKMQYGAAWWFLDNYDGIVNQINALSANGLLSNFVGMLTDSRSFMSFTRHEYFRRILCNMIGTDIHRGLLPKSEMETIGKMIENICYNNIKEYLTITP